MTLFPDFSASGRCVSQGKGAVKVYFCTKKNRKPILDLEILLVKIKSENEKLVELGKKKNKENGWNYKTVDNTGTILMSLEVTKVTEGH